MNEQYSNSVLIVDLDAVRDNLLSLKKEMGAHTAVMPVVKGDAFGLGLLPVARCLSETDPGACLAVAHLSEGVRLREGGITSPVLVLGGVLPQNAEAAVSLSLTVSVGRLGAIDLLAQEARRQNKKVKVHLKIDTGLGRLGVKPGAQLALLLVEALGNADCVAVEGVYSHFADAEDEGGERTKAQYENFLAAIEQIKAAGIAPGVCHIGNSAASEWFDDANLDAVRLGRRMFFDRPQNPTGTVREVASWRTLITNIRTVPAGELFGYGRGTILDRDAVIALIGVGYGDGLRQDIVAAHAPVMVHGKRAPIISMCMDQAFIDVTGIDCELGDEVTLFGHDGEGNFLSAQEVAAYANDEGCGLTAMLTPRVSRIYTNSGK